VRRHRTRGGVSRHTAGSLEDHRVEPGEPHAPNAPDSSLGLAEAENGTGLIVELEWKTFKEAYVTTPAAPEILLERYREKCHMAGGPRAGFVLRRRALLYVQSEHPDLDLEAGISTLEDQGLLKSSESGSFLFLTQAGVEALTESRHDPD
jgi:hypothetical protein